MNANGKEIVLSALMGVRRRLKIVFLDFFSIRRGSVCPLPHGRGSKKRVADELLEGRSWVFVGGSKIVFLDVFSIL
jgi:hypothetical protein